MKWPGQIFEPVFKCGGPFGLDRNAKLRKEVISHGKICLCKAED